MEKLGSQENNGAAPSLLFMTLLTANDVFQGDEILAHKVS